MPRQAQRGTPEHSHSGLAEQVAPDETSGTKREDQYQYNGIERDLTTGVKETTSWVKDQLHVLRFGMIV